MFSRMKIGVRLALGFALAVTMTALVGGVALQNDATLADITSRLYRHPFTVTNALAEANGLALELRSVVKDVVLADSPAEIDRAVLRADDLDQQFKTQMVLARERFLGDKTMVDDAMAAYEAWRPVRVEVIRLARAGQREDAVRLAKGAGSEQVGKVREKLTAVREWAKDRAGKFIGQADETSSRLLWIQSFLLCGALILSGLTSWGIAMGITRPITALTRATGYLAEGQLDNATPALDRHDEIGSMARAIDVWRDNARQRRAMTQAIETDRLAREQRAKQIETLTSRFDDRASATVTELVDSAAQLESSAQAMARVADQAAARANAVTSASNLASANVQTVAAAAEELAMSIREIGHQVEASKDVAQSATDEADRTDALVQTLAVSAQKIGEVVNLINDIASQTNLLALNATIEAARAGEAGKGFAVVANEVKSLANQTARATDEIAGQIAGVQDQTTKTVEALRGISLTIAKVSQISGSIAAAVEQQSAATHEIARSVQQASEGTTEVSSNAAEVLVGAREADRASKEVSQAASALVERANGLREDVHVFLASVSDASVEESGAFFEWNDQLLTGNPMIDQDHRKLVDYINQLYTAMQGGNGADAAIGIVDGLISYTREHFGREQNLMRADAYPDYDRHMAAHRDFIAKVDEFQKRINLKSGTVSMQVLLYLRDWLTVHIMKTDKEFAQHLARPGGQLAEA